MCFYIIDIYRDKCRYNNNFICFWTKCRFCTNTEQHLNKHISGHLNKRQFNCDKCNKRFKWKSNLVQHKHHIHSNDRPFVCPVSDCGKGFKTNGELNSHKAIHSDEKPFKCKVCDKRFKQKSNLISHQNCVHLNKRQFICDYIGCHQKFKRKSVLIKHKLIHSNEKPFKCDVKDCDQSFRQKSTLIQHKNRIHLRLKSHKCFHNNCDKSFVTSSELKRHIGYKHSTKKPFKCFNDNCNKRFKSKYEMYKHFYKISLIKYTFIRETKSFGLESKGSIGLQAM